MAKWTLTGEHDWSECSVSFGGDGSHHTVYEEGRELPIAFVIGDPGYWRDNSEADTARARLIAAAPELLEALKPFARYLEVLQEMGGNTPKTGPYMAVSSAVAGDAEITVEDMIAARAAIAKATGADQ